MISMFDGVAFRKFLRNKQLAADHSHEGALHFSFGQVFSEATAVETHSDEIRAKLVFVCVIQNTVVSLLDAMNWHDAAKAAEYEI